MSRRLEPGRRAEPFSLIVLSGKILLSATARMPGRALFRGPYGSGRSDPRLHIPGPRGHVETPRSSLAFRTMRRMFCHQAGDSTALVAAFGTHADDPTGSRDDTVFGGHVDERYGRDLR